jgi:hypothetical protein
MFIGVPVAVKSTVLRLVNIYNSVFLLKHERTRRFILQQISGNIRALSEA